MNYRTRRVIVRMFILLLVQLAAWIALEYLASR
jgi:hypothetical protein